MSGTRPCTTCGARAEGAAGPQRDNAPHREHGEGLRGSEACADYRAATPAERACATTGTACRPPEAAAAGAKALAGATEEAAARRPADQSSATGTGTEQAGRPGRAPGDEGAEGGAGGRPGKPAGAGGTQSSRNTHEAGRRPPQQQAAKQTGRKGAGRRQAGAEGRDQYPRASLISPDCIEDKNPEKSLTLLVFSLYTVLWLHKYGIYFI